MAIGFEDLKLGEQEETGEMPYRYSYSSGKDVIARLSVEVKDRPFSRYFISAPRVFYSIAHPEEECYLAYYLQITKKLILFNVTSCPRQAHSMKDVFRNYKGILERRIYSVKAENSCLDMELVL